MRKCVIVFGIMQGQRPPRKGQHKRIRKLTEPVPGRHNVSAEDIREELFGKDEDDDGRVSACLTGSTDMPVSEMLHRINCACQTAISRDVYAIVLCRLPHQRLLVTHTVLSVGCHLFMLLFVSLGMSLW